MFFSLVGVKPFTSIAPFLDFSPNGRPHLDNHMQWGRDRDVLLVCVLRETNGGAHVGAGACISVHRTNSWIDSMSSGW